MGRHFQVKIECMHIIVSFVPQMQLDIEGLSGLTYQIKVQPFHFPFYIKKSILTSYSIIVSMHAKAEKGSLKPGLKMLKPLLITKNKIKTTR